MARQPIRSIVSEEIERTFQELDAAIERRQDAEGALEVASGQCRDLVVSLLRSGVPRQELVGYPFSSSWLTRIQREEGIRINRRSPDVHRGIS